MGKGKVGCPRLSLAEKVTTLAYLPSVRSPFTSANPRSKIRSKAKVHVYEAYQKEYGGSELEIDLRRPLILSHRPALHWSSTAFSHTALALRTSLYRSD